MSETVTDKRATATPAKLDKILATLQNLMARIEDPRLEDGPEKDLMRETAERLIRDYRIQEDELLTADREAGRAPVAVPSVRKFRLCRESSEYRSLYLDLIWSIAYHCEVRVTATADQDEDGVWWWVAAVVGYEGDTRYAEAMFTEARAYFANRMEPTVDNRLSDAENVYRLRSAGIERGRIGQMMGWGDKAHMKVTKLYKEECARREEPAVMTGKGNSMKTFREAFTMAFPNTLRDRLYRVKASAGSAIVLKGRKEAVDEKFYELYPRLRPVEVATTTREPVKQSRRSSWTKADQARWERLHDSAPALLGHAAGEAAAREINVKGTTDNRLEN